MANRGENESRSDARRISIASAIDLEFPNFEGLITRMSANLSALGMFVESEAVEPPGTKFKFNLQVDDWSAIHGSAEVVWIRSTGAGPERPAGMGVKFLELDQESRRTIRWLVDKHLQAGGQEFDPDKVPAGASKYSRRGRTPAADERTSLSGRNGDDSSNRALPSSIWLRGPWIVASLILAAVIGLSAYRVHLDRQPGRGRLQPPRVDIEAPSGPQTESPIGSSSVQPATIEEISEFLRVWSTALEEGDQATLEHLYSDGRSIDIETPAPEPLIPAPSDGRIGVSALEVAFPTSNTALATFNQSVQSFAGIEVRRTVLELELVEGSWKIRQQRFLD